MKQTLVLVTFLVIASVMLADGVQPSGSGTEYSHYQIQTLDNLLWVSTNSASWGCYFDLHANIDASATSTWNGGAGFSPIGNETTPFTGFINGWDRSIDGLYINRPSSDYQGLFGKTQNACIVMLKVTNASVTGHEYVGCVAGCIVIDGASELTDSITSSGSATGYRYVGGIAGMVNHASMYDCQSSATVTATNNSGGGLVGNCTGIMSVVSCCATGNVSGGTSCGGLIGEVHTKISISRCYSTGNVSGGSSSYNVGGLVGNSYGAEISNCYSLGNVSGSAIRAGGLAGTLRDTSSVSYCYSMGAVSGTGSCGGLIGSDYTSNSTTSASFWDTQTSGQSTSGGGEGKTTQQMKSVATYIGAGWDWLDETANGNSNYWGINSEVNGGYPFLAWQGYTNAPPAAGDVHITANTIWSTDQLLGSNIIVDNGVTLTIEPGVTVSSTAACTLQVLGTLLAQGNQTLPITFNCSGVSQWGGIIFDNTSTANDSSRFEHCVFYSCYKADGAALYVNNYSKLILGHCHFMGGQAANHGGAVYIANAAPLLESCEFVGCQAGADGGAVYLDNADVTLLDCTFEVNEAGEYGGGLCINGCSPDVIGCKFDANTAEDWGGGILVYQNSVPVVVNCGFANNSARSGGGFAEFNAGGTLANCLFVGNTATNECGGALLGGTSAQQTHVVNCTFLNNGATGTSAYAGGVGMGTYVSLKNCIFWGNTADAHNNVFIGTGTGCELHYCVIEGMSGEATLANADEVTHCMSLDPNISGVTIDGYTLGENSPCIDAGDPATAPTGPALFDLMGNPRVYSNIRIDIGAVEYQGGSLNFPDGTVIANDIYLDDDHCVLPGCSLTIEPDVTLTFAPGAGLYIYGELQATGSPDSLIVFTEAVPGAGWGGLHFISEERLTRASALEYCVIEYGSADALRGEDGGNILVSHYGDVAPTGLSMVNCRIHGGQADNGAGLHTTHSAVLLTGCLLHSNEASTCGGAIYDDSSSIILTNCTLADNTAPQGSAVYHQTCLDVHIRNSIVCGQLAPAQSSVTYSLVQGGYAGEGNIDADPCFLGEGESPYAVQAWSPVLNAGNPSTAGYGLPALDLAGNPRVHHHSTGTDRVDMGAYEYPGIKAPTGVQASDGSNDYPGYVYITWDYDATYSPQPMQYRIYRDSTAIITISASSMDYMDDTAAPGQLYRYQVQAISGTETAMSTPDTGFIRPEGIISGAITTMNYIPVGGITVSLSPSPGNCLLLDSASSITIQNPVVDMDYDFTFELWVRTTQASCDILSRGDHRFGVDAGGHATYTDGVVTLASTVAMNDGEWHHLAVVQDCLSGHVLLYLDGGLAGDQVGAFGGFGNADVVSAAGFVGALDDIRIWNVARTAGEIEHNMSVIAAWDAPGLAGYWAMNEGFGQSLFDATNYAHNGIISGCEWSDDDPDITLGAVTDEFGLYAITQIPFGTSTTFTVTPSAPGHSFQPQRRLVTLSTSNIAQNSVDFFDNSYIPISGHVYYSDTVCPVAGATIHLNGEPTSPQTTTNSDGYYVLEVEHSAPCTLSVVYGNHTFNRTWALGSVTAPHSDVDFLDMTVTSLRVETSGGDDNWCIGDFTVQLETTDGLFTWESVEQGVSWNGIGMDISGIPPVDYNVTVFPVGDNGLHLAVDSQFLANNTQPVSLQGGGLADVDTLRIGWRAPLQAETQWPASMELEHFAAYPQSEFYVVQQNHWCEVEVTAFEDYSCDGHPNQRSYIAGCDVVVDDEIGSTGGTTSSFGGSTSFTYLFAPYLPNVLSGYNRQYQNSIEFLVTSGDRTASHIDWALTEGEYPLESTYATTSPELPFLILHDPPGDGSYSSFCNSSSHTVAMSSSVCTDIATQTYAVVNLGVDVTTTVGWFFCTELDVDVTNDYETGITTTTHQSEVNEQSVTFTTTEEYATSASDDVIGDGADVFVGGAINLLWGVTRVISWNGTGVDEGQSIMVTPNGFATQYIYTENQIANTVIPNLLALSPPDTTSAALWQSYLDMNEANRSNPDPNPNHPGNFSFNAGAAYTYVEETTSSASHTIEFDTTVDEAFGAEIGATVNGVGGAGGFTFSTQITIGACTTTTNETTTTTSFVLDDDDITSELNELADYFTVDVGVDPVYGTPVFDLVSGASSNPWEPNTQPRDGVSFQTGGNNLVDVPENDAAAFILMLGNTSQTGEARRYYLAVNQSTNNTGATMRINGVAVEDAIAFDVPPDSVVQAIMTVEHGPLSYEVDSLAVEFYAAGDRTNAGPTGHWFSRTQYFNVHWQAPYSRVSVLQPEDNWLVNRAMNSTLPVMLAEYDSTRGQLVSLQLQYRRSSSDDWVPAVVVPRSELGEAYTEILWDVSGLADGPCQIRAAAVDAIRGAYCTAALHGVIDRECPQVWGVPQPADGILGAGDVIGVSFDEDIDPASIAGSVTLTIVRTEQNVDVDVTCYGNSLSIVPCVANHWLENETLRASVSGVKDLHGNALESAVQWEFFVNANPVGWETTKIELIKPLGEEMTFSVNLVNTGGETLVDTLRELPDWLSAIPMNSTLAPLDYQTVTFTISAQIGFGSYSGTLYADVPGYGCEPLTVEVSVLADPPQWSQTWSYPYDHSMTITGRMCIDDEVSMDPGDIIGAFVQNGSGVYECRGVAQTEYVDYLGGSWQFFLTVHSDVEYGQPLLFRVWDHSMAKEHYGVLEDYTFYSGASYGSPVAPDTLHARDELVQEVACAAGWTWLSTHLQNGQSMAVDSVLASLSPATGDIVKNQTDYAQYAAGTGWVGTLDSLNTTGMFKLKLSDGGQLSMTGLLQDPELTEISYGAGWNWIGYTPHVSICVNDALADVELATGDVVKSQSAYAQYIAGYGWAGSLRFMNPGEGYMLQTAGAGSFHYPAYSIPRDAVAADSMAILPSVPGWVLDPLAYEYSQNVTGVLQQGGVNLQTGAIIGAFIGDECRGMAAPMDVLGERLYFLTIYANTYGEAVTFRAYDPAAQAYYDLTNTMDFVNNQVVGTPLDPYAFEMPASYLGAPQNVRIDIDGGEVTLLWDAVPGAAGYIVYSSPDMVSWSAEAQVSATNWSETASVDRRFYRVTATTEAPAVLPRKAPTPGEEMRAQR